MITRPEIELPRVAPDRLLALMSVAGLSQMAAARQLGVAEKLVHDWCSGVVEAPRMALYALEYLAALACSDTDAVSMACRAAAVQARVDANKAPDPLPALALISIAEVYERMARYRQAAESPTAAADTRKPDDPRPS